MLLSPCDRSATSFLRSIIVGYVGYERWFAITVSSDMNDDWIKSCDDACVRDGVDVALFLSSRISWAMLFCLASGVCLLFFVVLGPPLSWRYFSAPVAQRAFRHRGRLLARHYPSQNERCENIFNIPTNSDQPNAVKKICSSQWALLNHRCYLRHSQR